MIASAASSRRALRFCLVGASGVVVNTGVLVALVHSLHAPPVPAGAVSTECAIISNFCLNDSWTFHGRRTARPWVSRLLAYNLLSLASLTLSVATLAVLHQVAGVQYLVANLVAIGVGTLWNYVSNSRWNYQMA